MNLRRIRTTGLTALATLLAAAFLASPRAQAQEMPLEIHTRYWESPGPVQDEAGAPRLLIMYPVKEGSATSAKTVRYAGRVEPEDAKVTLNGRELKVYPGGVFTGLREVEDEDKDYQQTWRFEASAKGKKTTVRRTVKLQRPTPVPKASPLSFFATPVSPTGTFVLPEGETLEVKLYGSPGATAEYKIGDGAWQAMDKGEADAKRGAVYKAKLTPPVVDKAGPRKVTFRLSAQQDGERKTITRDPGLSVAAMAPGAVYAGEITQYVATYLKNPEGWDRWGNWLEGTRFPVLEVRGDRARTDFGGGAPESKGWLELIHSKIDWTSTSAAGLPDFASNLETTNLPSAFAWSWPGQRHPAGTVFAYDPALGGGGKLSIAIPGATAEGSGESEVESETLGKLRRVSQTGKPPRITAELRQPLWGFGMQADPAGGFEVLLRTPPQLAKATAAKPLAGLRVMIDAGHGGDDPGALGPSGITEADLNLVQAAWLEKYLIELGAEIKQVRRGDVKVELDDVCKLAIEWDPDLFVSLHHNSVGGSTDPMSDAGPIVFYHYTHSHPLAEAIAAPLDKAFGAGKGARTKESVFRVTRNFNLCPSVLVETAYVCNAEDDFKLRKTETTKQTAKAVADGIKAYVTGLQLKAGE